MSLSEAWPKRAADFIPHSGLMCVVDDLLFVGGGIAEATAVIRENNPSVGADGILDRAVYVEMIAQTIAAGSGYELTKEKRKTQEGYLLGIKTMKMMGSARAGDILRIKAHKYAEYGDFGIIEGTIYRGEEILATGEIKVFQTFEKKPAGSVS